MATYYVATTGNNGSAGTIESPWATITYAMSAVSPVAPGDTVYVRGGTYNERVVISKDGTVGNGILLSAYQSESVVVDGSRTITGWQACSSQEDALGNANWQNIYKVTLSLSKALKYFVLYENGSFLFLAKRDNQTNRIYDIASLYAEVPSESDTLKDGLIDNTLLTQAADYWNGCFVYIWSQLANNVIIEKTIADFDANLNKLIFDAPLTYAIKATGTTHDRYTIGNHIDFINKAGEYCYIANGGNSYTIYCWPESTESIANTTIKYSYYDVGIIAGATGGMDYVTVKDIEIFGFATRESNGRDGGIIVPSGFVHTHLAIDNAHIHGCAGGGIVLVSGSYDSVLNCTVEDIQNGNGIGFVGSYTRIGGNIVRRVSGTGIAPRGAYLNPSIQCIVYGNIVTDTGLHGNGIAAYTNCEDLLIANNIVVTNEVACTISTSKNITLYNNVFYTTGITGAADWGGMTGFVRIINNTIQGAGFSFGTTDKSIYTVINNIMAGGVPEGSTHFNNAFTAPAWYMGPEDYTDGEFIETDETKFFVDYANKDFDIKEGSPSINGGVDVSDYLPIALFPDFDFDLDIGGNTRVYDNTIDLGAYEYSGSAQEPPLYTLQSSVEGLGTISSGGSLWTANTANYESGTSLYLTANELRNSIFDGWTGDVVSSERTIQVTMNANKAIVANFVSAVCVSRPITIGTATLFFSRKKRV